ITNQGRAVYFTHSLPDDHARDYQYRIYWAEASGQLVRHEQAIVRANDPGLQLRTLLAAIVPGPALASGFAATIRPFHIMELRPGSSYRDALTRSVSEYWSALLLAGLIGFVCAVLCYRRQLRCAASGAERFVWPIFVFLFGIPGWVGYLTCRT